MNVKSCKKLKTVLFSNHVKKDRVKTEFSVFKNGPNQLTTSNTKYNAFVIWLTLNDICR